MRLLADLHTHTIASGHAYATVTEMATAAAERGLEAIGIMDHGPLVTGAPQAPYFGSLPSLPLRIGGVIVLTGVEANIVDEAGTIDLPERILSRLDFVAVGLHRGFGVASDDVERNTRALLAAMRNPLVDLITHPGRVEADMGALVEAAAIGGIALELNDLSWGPHSREAGREREREIIGMAADAGVRIAISSDAHFTDRVGAFDRVLPIAAELGLAEADIVNRDAESVRAFLLGRRARPRLDEGWGA
jgi:putative hydrolase